MVQVLRQSDNLCDIKWLPSRRVAYLTSINHYHHVTVTQMQVRFREINFIIRTRLEIILLAINY